MGIERWQQFPRLLIGLFSLLILSLSPAHAACTNPSMPDGSLFYNAAQNVPQVCAGGNWIALGALNPGAGGGACSSPTMAEGSIFYNDDFDVLQYCNGTDWKALHGTTGTGGYLVQSYNKWNGDLGGLSGADAKCLSDLQTYDWLGKSDAGTLTAARVKALLCDSTSCNQAEPETDYRTAVANNTALGGIGFRTDDQGRGIGNSTYFDEDNYENVSGFWSNRGTVNAETWSNSPQGTNHCTNWSVTSGNGRVGNMANNNALRWNESSYSCNSTRYLMCLVNP
jgi:hypothetical protein